MNINFDKYLKAAELSSSGSDDDDVTSFGEEERAPEISGALPADHNLFRGGLPKELNKEDEDDEQSTSSVASEEEDESDEEEEDDDFDGSFSSVGGSDSNGVVTESQPSESRRLASKEEAKVRMSRYFVLTLLLLVGLALSIATYFLLRNAEYADYEHSRGFVVSSIEDGIQVQTSSIEKGMSSLSNQITVQSLSTTAGQSSFPEVTLEYFELYAGNARENTGGVAASGNVIESVTYCPYVVGNQRTAWEAYAQSNAASWLDISYELYSNASLAPNAKIEKAIHTRTASGVIVPSPIADAYLPLWQISPPPPQNDLSIINWDLFSWKEVQQLYANMNQADSTVLSAVVDIEPLRTSTNETNTTKTVVAYPVRSSLDTANTTAGALLSVMVWDFFFENMLPSDVKGIVCVLKDNAGQMYAYELNGDTATPTDVTPYENLDSAAASIPVFEGMIPSTGNESYQYTVYVFSTAVFRQTYETVLPIVFAVAVAAGFLFIAASFVYYDRFVQRRNAKVIGAAERTAKIVASLFPKNVHERLFGTGDMEEQTEEKSSKKKNKKSKKKRKYDVEGHLLHGEDEQNTELQKAQQNDDELGDDEEMFKTKPIADLFPSTTIMFADIAGFTAWSSSREPSQVFVLLETVYRAFDLIAKKRGVFKVETVGDCYVAVCGLPQPREDHAVVMAKFARDCMRKMDELTKRLEVRLGPDTGDLAMRMGLHSGPVTGGVLRGEGSRFQLFGDTMNTASRTETTGERCRIHISQTTADQLKEHGKEKWFVPREEKVYAKGKGHMQTYWLRLGKEKIKKQKKKKQETEEDESSYYSESSWESDDSDYDTDLLVQDLVSGKTARLIEWNVEVLARLLKKIVARRSNSEPTEWRMKKKAYSKGTVIDEVEEIIALPDFDAKTTKVYTDADVEHIVLPPAVLEELQDFVTNIALMYRDNPFHNFEHASHVTMSVVKFMSRIVAPTGKDASELHDHTYGITSDPLTQFACVLSALIHDVDHPGVPNSQLIKEETKLARHYNGKSVAEQNSVDLAWELLTDDSYHELVHTLCGSESEWKRFRQLVVNSVMATDIVDKELKKLRDGRWATAFSADGAEANDNDNINRKATIVIEHLIQASDVSHTMQHWQIYRKWNGRLFLEMYKAYREGRAETDPSKFWYEGELKFFDFYIIPLAKKLQECGVFGVSCDEILDYATKNRENWELQGQEIVKAMVSSFDMSVQGRRLSNELNVSLHSQGSDSAESVGGGQVHGTRTSMSSALGSLMKQVQQLEAAENALERF